MKRLINNGDIFDKYASFEEKKFRDHTIEQFNWYGDRHISGTYKGAAYSTSLGDNFIATDLRSDSNPKGSILKEAKNYTDSKVAGISTSAIVQQANAYTDTKFTAANSYTDTKFTAAKNYTDSKVKYLYYHFINLQGTSGHVYFTYISEYASQYTIATLKNALYGKTLVCSGFLNGSVAEYITSEGGNLSVGVVDVSDGSTTGEIIDKTFYITDEVASI